VNAVLRHTEVIHFKNGPVFGPPCIYKNFLTYLLTYLLGYTVTITAAAGAEMMMIMTMMM